MRSGTTIEISFRALIDIERGLTTVKNIKKFRKIGRGSWLGKKELKKRKD